jgi:murein DD-endopeptidase MepM/ murein hydrolase activator NlpD
VPQYWPLDDTGFLTRGQIGGTGTEAHPGIDIAVPTGSIVRAAAGGRVADAGQDPEYGWFVLLQHADGYQSMYGHLSRRLVATGDSVTPGQVIGLTGSTGRSTAPHLHFEIRRQGASLDPLTMVKEGRQ